MEPVVLLVRIVKSVRFRQHVVLYGSWNKGLWAELSNVQIHGRTFCWCEKDRRSMVGFGFGLAPWVCPAAKGHLPMADTSRVA